jgi:putative peptide zinc metalloprotease protein
MPDHLLQLAPGIELSAFDADGEAPTYLARTAEGRHFRLTEPLYHLLACMGEPIAPAAVAAELRRAGIDLTADDMLRMVAVTLAPAGLVIVDGAAPAPARPTPQDGLLSLRWRHMLLPAERLRPWTQVLSWAYRPAVVAGMIAMVIAAHAITYARLGFPPAAEGLATHAPLIVLALLAMSIVHEIGHLAACRFWNCPHGGLGVGLYLLAPVFFADVSPAWRLRRWQRACVDMGGIYFQLLCTPVLVGLCLITRSEAWLWAVVMCDLSALLNLNPFAKLDGYWLLSDVLGVANLHRRTRERLAAMFGRSQPAQVAPFGRATRAVSTAVLIYLAASVAVWPMLLLYQALMVTHALSIYPSLWQDALFFSHTATSADDARIVGQVLLQLVVVTAVLLQLGLIVVDAARGVVHGAMHGVMRGVMRGAVRGRVKGQA